MATVSLPELDTLAAALAGEDHDAYSHRALARSFEEYAGRRRPALSEVTIWADGKEYAHLAAFLADPTARFQTGEIRLTGPPPAASAWRFLVPFERMVFAPDGSIELHRPGGAPPMRGIARVLLREHYQVRSQDEEERGATGGTRVELRGIRGTVAEAAEACRAERILPFAVAVLAYLPEERIRYEFDTVHTSLLPDPRAGRLSPQRRTRRSARLSWALDQYVAKSDLSQFGIRCLEVLVDSPGLTSVEVAHVLGGVREHVDSTLQGLVQRRLASFDPRTGVYRARLEAFEPEVAPPRPEAIAPSTDPALRTSVQELIAAADARATCPLCGRVLPSGPKAILCADCAALVGPA